MTRQRLEDPSQKHPCADGLEERRRKGRVDDLNPNLVPLLRRAGRDRAKWAVPSLLGVIWLICLSAVIALEASAQFSASAAADVTWMWNLLGLPFSVDGARVIHVALAKLMIASVAVLPVLMIEAAVCGARDCSIGRLVINPSTSVVYDWLIFTLNFVSAWKLFELVFSLGGIIIVSKLLAITVAALAGGGSQLSTGYVAADAVLAFLLFTLSDYCGHRFLHTRFFFPLHRMHHTANEMSVATLWRNNPGVATIEALYKVWPLALFKLPFEIVATLGLGVMAYQCLIHSNIRWTWGWFGRWLLHPPAAHRLHHSVDANHLNCNLGTIVIWDRIFNTWIDPSTVPLRLGVEGGQYNTGSLFAEIVRDLRIFAFDQWRRSSGPDQDQDAAERMQPPATEAVSVDGTGSRP